MQFRRSGQRDDRRRRVLLDERTEGGNADDRGTASRATATGRRSARTSNATAGASPAVGYSPVAQHDQQPRTVDLLPKRRWWVGTVISLLMLPAAGLIWLEYVATQTDRGLPDAVAHLQPSLPAGADAWFASSLFLICAVVALQVLALRRHKSDDYRGTYRVWGWIAALFMMASLEATAGISQIADRALGAWSGVAHPVAGVSWSSWTIAAIGLALAVRMWFELQESKATLVAVAAATACYITATLATAAPHGWLAPIANSVCLQTMVLGGHVLLLTSLFSFARFVYRDANGLVDRAAREERRAKRAEAARRRAEQREAAADESSEAAETRAPRRKKKTDTQAETETSSQEQPQDRGDADSTGRRQTSQPAKRAPEAPAQEEDPDILSIASGRDADRESKRRLSKSEKRRLRKASRDQQKRAA